MAEELGAVTESIPDDDIELDGGDSPILQPDDDDGRDAPPKPRRTARDAAAELAGDPDPADDDDPETPDDEVEPGDPEPEAPADAEPAKPKRKQTRKEREAELQARINARTRELRDLDRQLEQRRRESTPPAAPKTPPPAPKPAAVDLSDLGERPEWRKWETEGKDFDEFLTARTEYDTAVAERRAVAAANETFEARTRKAQDAARDAEFDRRMAATHEKHPDLKTLAPALDHIKSPFLESVIMNHEAGGEVLYNLASDVPQAEALAALLPKTVEELRRNRPFVDAVRTSPDPWPLLTYFAENSGEYQRIAAMPPALALMALGELKATLVRPAGAMTGSPAAAAPITSAAPPPGHKAGTRSAGGTRKPEAESVDDYIRRTNKEQGYPT